MKKDITHWASSSVMGRHKEDQKFHDIRVIITLSSVRHDGLTAFYSTLTKKISALLTIHMHVSKVQVVNNFSFTHEHTF